MDLALYKEFYDHEWQRHEQLQSAVNTPISIVTLLAGGLVLMAKGFATASPHLQWLFWITAAIAGILLGGCVYLLTRSVHGYQYSRIPLPAEVARHHERLRAFYREKDMPGLADPRFEAYLMEKYVAAAERNAVNNLNRSRYLFRANQLLVFALCAAGAAAVPAAVAAKEARPLPTEVRITNLRSDARAILEAWQAERARTGDPHDAQPRRGR